MAKLKKQKNTNIKIREKCLKRKKTEGKTKIAVENERKEFVEEILME